MLIIAIVGIGVAWLVVQALDIGSAQQCSQPAICPTPQSQGVSFNVANIISDQQIAQVAQVAGLQGDDLSVAVAIALAESGGNPSAIGDKKLAPERGPSIGLWQINIGSKEHPEWSGLNLADPAVNASCMFVLYSNRGGGFQDWSTFTGAGLPAGSAKPYTKYLVRANQAVSQLLAGNISSCSCPCPSGAMDV
jgi:hypothetical protein